MVQVGKVELLQLAVLSFAQSSGKAVGGAGGGTSDEVPTWTAADVAAICSRVQGLIVMP